MFFRRRRKPLPELNIDRSADEGVVPMDHDDPVTSAPSPGGYGDGAGGNMDDIITASRTDASIRRDR